MTASSLRKVAALVGLLAGASAIGIAFYIHSAQPKLGPSWHLGGTVVSSPRLLAAMGVVMIVGALLTLWNAVVGGLIVLVPAMVGLVYTYDHEWYRVAMLKVWAAPVLLAWLGGILAGYVLLLEVKQHGQPAAEEVPALPVEGTAPVVS